MNKPTREQLIEIFRKNFNIFKSGSYHYNGVKVPFVKVVNMMSRTKLYESIHPVKNLPYYENPIIYAENIDTFDKVMSMGPKAACLNMASFRLPGGGVLKGASAQEESLCRRSNLYLSLRSVKYPLPFYGGVYSPCVNIFRDFNYKTLEAPFVTNVISVAALCRPKVDEEGKLVYSAVHAIKNKIRTILRIAILEKHSKLVLGAFGCGAYGNPARQVAELFKEVLSEDEFSHSFEEICFAVLEDKNSIRPDNKEGNLVPFIETFNKK